MGKEFSSSTLH